MMKYPLIKKCGLNIKYLSNEKFELHSPHVRADDLEAFLERAPVIKGGYPDGENFEQMTEDAPYTARLILIEEIKPQTLEDKIKRILDDHGMTDQKALEEIRDLVERGE